MCAQCLTLWDSMDCSQSPLYMELFRQEYWSGLPFPTPGDLPCSGIEPVLPASPALGGWFFTTELKKEFIGPGLHLRPVHADHAQPPFQWTLNSVFSAYENNNRRVRPPPDRGTLKIVSRLLTCHKFFCINRSVTSGFIDYWLIVWLFEHMSTWHVNDGVIGIVFSLVYVSLKEFGVVGSDTYTWGI